MKWSRVRAGSAVAGLAVVGALATATPAFANSFSGSDAYASWSYDDGGDSFCVSPKNGATTSVKLSPVTSGRGPSYSQTITSKKCFSLATAYEDSKYNWSVGTRGAFHSGTFYS